MVKNVLRRIIASIGWDVRLTSSLRKARLEEKRQAQIQPWAQLRRYKPATILDIGANDGYSVIVFRELMPDVIIHSFEPLGDCFQKAAQVLAERPPGKVHHCALGDVEETRTIHRSDFTPSSSLLPMDRLHREEFPQSAKATAETIKVCRLDNLAPHLNLLEPMVAKIDVQGFEDRVIRGGEQTLRKTSAIVVEVSSYSLYEGQPSFADVHEQLSHLGFVFRGTIDQMLSPKDGRILQFDALFENEKLLAQLPEATLRSPVHAEAGG
jgi:FkbM family methyltransferase